MFSRLRPSLPSFSTFSFFSSTHQRPNPAPNSIPGVRHVVAIASGKGGVGKSTVSVNVAIGLRMAGLRVGIMDADIYGPSIPLMMNINKYSVPFNSDQSEQSSETLIDVDPISKKMIPLQNHGLQCMSMGFLVPSTAPTIWRGPMVMSAVDQLLFKVQWGNLDVLIVDMPPGTGDAALTLAQRVALSGAVIVSTPQDVALADVRKGVNMFKKISVPIFGLVENMSYYSCPQCGHSDPIFGQHGAQTAASEMNIEFLGKIPLNRSICETSDQGNPIIVSVPDSAEAKAFSNISLKIKDKLSDLDSKGISPSSPKLSISFE